MFGKKNESDLTSPDAVAESQKVYDRIASGKCKDAKAELDTAHGRGKKKP